MSSLRGTGRTSLQEAVEEVPRVVRARARLGVVLDRRAGHVAQHQALDRAVVEVQLLQLGDPKSVSQRMARRCRSCARRPGQHREAVVLRGDVDPARSRGP